MIFPLTDTIICVKHSLDIIFKIKRSNYFLECVVLQRVVLNIKGVVYIYLAFIHNFFFIVKFISVH